MLIFRLDIYFGSPSLTMGLRLEDLRAAHSDTQANTHRQLAHKTHNNTACQLPHSSSPATQLANSIQLANRHTSSLTAYSLPTATQLANSYFSSFPLTPSFFCKCQCYSTPDWYRQFLFRARAHVAAGSSPSLTLPLKLNGGDSKALQATRERIRILQQAGYVTNGSI